MKIAVIGYGNVGRSLGLGWAKKGHDVLFGVRDVEKPEVRAFHASQSGIVIEPVSQAIDEADTILLATPYEAAKKVVETAGDLAGKVVLDCTNPIGPGLVLTVGLTTSGAEEIAKLARGASVVKSFNTTGWENLAHSTYPGYGGLRPIMFVCGDDERAKAKVCRLAEDLGFEPYDWGPLSGARYLEPMAMVWIVPGRAQGRGPNFAFALLRR